MDKLLPTDGAFLLHYLRSVVQTRTWYEATKARINHVNPQEYGWKPLDEGFTAIAVENDIFPELLLIVCGCQSCNCVTRMCHCSSNIIPFSDLCSFRLEFCENTNPKEILKDDSSDDEDDVNEEEGENGE